MTTNTIQTPAGTFTVVSRKTAEDFADNRAKLAQMERDGIDAVLVVKKEGRSKKLYECVEFGGNGEISHPTEIREVANKPAWISDDSRD